MSFTNKQLAFQWFTNELWNLFVGSDNDRLNAEEVLQWLGETDRGVVFRPLFFRALEERRWSVAQALLTASGSDIIHAPEHIHGNVLETALRVLGDRSDVLKWLIEKGAPVNGTDHFTSPLTAAVGRECSASVDLLLEAGANPKFVTGPGDDNFPALLGHFTIALMG